MDTLQLFSSHISSSHLNFLHTFLSSTYVGLSLYGLLLVCTNMMMTSLLTSLAVFLSLTTLVIYFKVPRTPQKQIDAIFGNACQNLQPENSDSSNSNSNSNGVLTNGVELLRRHDEESSRGLNGSSTKANGHSQVNVSPPVLIVGHRGAGLDAPENSLSAFRQCKERGYPFVEFDVSLTKDNVPVIFHDDDLKRIAGRDQLINDVTWSELQEIDISLLHPLGDRYRGERIPKFEDAVKLLLDLKMKFIIDLKDTNEHVINAVCEAFEKNPQMYEMVVVSSFMAKVVYDIRRRDPKIMGCMAWRPESHRYKVWNVDSDLSSVGSNKEKRHSFFLYDWLAFFQDLVMDWALRNFIWWFVGLGAILLQKDSVSRHEIVSWTKNGVKVLLWTVNSPVEKLHLSQVVQIGYLTDTLDGNVLTHRTK